MIAKKRGSNTVKHVVIENNRKVLRMHHFGASTVEIASETGLTIRAVNLRRKEIRRAEEEGELEYSPLHDKPYEGPRVRPSTFPIEKAGTCSDEIIRRFMDDDECEEVKREVERMIAQFQAGKEPSRPELVIPNYESSPRRGSGSIGFEPAATPKS